MTISFADGNLNNFDVDQTNVSSTDLRGPIGMLDAVSCRVQR
jgi:hypothetical protein